jgi:hypothetical protein
LSNSSSFVIPIDWFLSPGVMPGQDTRNCDLFADSHIIAQQDESCNVQPRYG